MRICPLSTSEQDDPLSHVCKNESQKCIRQISVFAQSNLNVNVVVLNLPNRRDLADQSCVNKEIDRYNRRLGKHLKVFDRVYYKVINYERKFHTKHGMHLNTMGKEYVARQLTSLISFIGKKPIKEERAIISL
jgi:hypothetical protein